MTRPSLERKAEVKAVLWSLYDKFDEKVFYYVGLRMAGTFVRCLKLSVIKMVS